MLKLLSLMVLAGTAGAVADSPTAETVVARAIEAAGGREWLEVQTNVMRGHATLCRDGRPERCVHADEYTMYRVYPDEITAAHAGSGKFRLDARVDGHLLFQNSFDGRYSWTHEGRVPEAEAIEERQSNFGFSAIRFAGRDGFPVTLLVDDSIDGEPTHVIRVGDPAGGSTLFWIAQDTGLVRAAAWNTPRGWHRRVYSEYYGIPGTGFMQPGRVRLYYNDIRVADISWTEASINEPIDDDFFVLGPVTDN